jgi:hypothetical protein
MPESAHQIRIDASPAEYDRLFDRETGLVRWPLLMDRTTVALSRAKRAERGVAVFVLENPRSFDGTAPEFADFAVRLRERVRPDDTVARAAPRTFVIVCNDIVADEDAAGVARRLVLGAGVLCRLGVALASPEDSAGSLLDRALRDADQVLRSSSR